MKNDIKDFECPVCNGMDFEVIEESEKIEVPFGDDENVTLIKLRCKDCETITEYSKIFDTIYTQAVDKAQKKSIENMLDSLTNRGYNLAAIERALDLPQRTMSRWKNSGDLSSTGLALLRVISTYPWIINVAQNKFDPACARNIYIQNAVAEFIGMYSSLGNTYFSQFGILTNAKNLFVIAKYDFRQENKGMNENEKILQSPMQIASSSLNSFFRGI